MTRLLVRWVPAAAWAAFLFFMSSRESLPVDLDSGLDKVAHFGAYLVLGFLLARATSPSDRWLILAIAIGWGVGALDELFQSTVPGRHASVGDWLADAAGTVAGVLVYYFTVRSRSPAPEPMRDVLPSQPRT